MNWMNLVSVVSALWAGFVLAISFMESWVKFRAKGVTVPVGLSIGSLVFRILNRIEWVLLSVIICILILSGITANFSFIFMLSVILVSQTFLLLPLLTKRATTIINGGQPQKSKVHFLFVGLEVVKVVFLIALSLQHAF